jgi:23S rRNA (uracil1939-C5)-methyltransferase
MTERRLVIERLGHRGEGVARLDGKLVFVPYALAGETVLAEVDGDFARLVEILDASPDRIAPSCPHYGQCGGCAVQALAPKAYTEWKRGLVVSALRNAGLDLDVASLVDAHGAGRRRATFHARMENGQARVGFMRARSHGLIEIDACPLLASELAGALPAARALAQRLVTRAKPLDIVVAATPQGLDIDIRGAGALEDAEIGALIAASSAHDIARLSNHGRLVVSRQAPRIAIGAAIVTPPPGVFLQATRAGEEAIAARVLAATRGAKRVADLFCGIGAFALRLASRATVTAYDSDAAAIAAMVEAARNTPGLRPLDAQARDLFKRPLSAQELNSFDAIVFDPPRAGARAQAEQIAKSKARIVVAVSCNAQSFARDAVVLLEGGYVARQVIPIDQFRFSPHAEIVAAFERATPAGGKRRSLLS